jgi:hypothetical protein
MGIDLYLRSREAFESPNEQAEIPAAILRERLSSVMEPARGYALGGARSRQDAMSRLTKHNMVLGVFLIAATLGSTHLALATEQPATQSPAAGGLDGGPLRIMPLGDSITVGFTDNPSWTHPFEFGYRSGLYRRLKEAEYDFVFVGSSKEPFTNPRRFADPTHGGTVSPTLDLRTLNQNGHHGHGGFGIDGIQKFAPEWIKKERPDLILLLIGINKMSLDSPRQLEALVRTIFSADEDVALIVAQITPSNTFNQHILDYNTFIRETLVPKYAAEGYTISTVDLYAHFLTDPQDPRSVDATRLSNGRNHPANPLYDKMAESWFEGIELLLEQKQP